LLHCCDGAVDTVWSNYDNNDTDVDSDSVGALLVLGCQKAFGMSHKAHFNVSKVK